MMDENKALLEEMKRKIEDHAVLEMRQQALADKCFDSLERTLEELRAAKPNERGELTRHYAVTVTELEKVIAYFVMYVVNAD